MKRSHKDNEKVPNDSGGSEDDNAMEETLKKGPWTKAEDDVLIAYIEQHGEGNWNAVQKYSTLSRCGKSCRFRWMNHLRPNLKKGAFTDEEEQRVAELHARIGNKWSRMAAELPGRTDNEIKNFWHTRRKRLKRQGLPVYSDEVREKAAAHSGLNTNPSMDTHSSPDLLGIVNYEEVPILDFKFLRFDPSLSCYQSMFPTNGSFLRQRHSFSQPNMYNSVASSPGTTFPFTSGGSMNEQSLPFNLKLNIEDVVREIDLLDNATSPSDPLFPRIENVEELLSFLDLVSDLEPGTLEALQYELNPELQPLSSTLEHVPDIHCLNSATYYSPFELPSELGTCWGTQQCDLIPELESDNTLVQSPLADQALPNFSPLLYDGLLEPIGYGSTGESRATETNPEDPLVIPSLLLPPSTSNITGQNFNFETDQDYSGGSTSTSAEDWLAGVFSFLNEDTNNTM